MAKLGLFGQASNLHQWILDQRRNRISYRHKGITHRMNIEPTLHGEQAEFDTENEDEYLLALQYHNDLLDGLQSETDDHESRISTNEQDIDDIESGNCCWLKLKRISYYSAYFTQSTR